MKGFRVTIQVLSLLWFLVANANKAFGQLGGGGGGPPMLPACDGTFTAVAQSQSEGASFNPVVTYTGFKGAALGENITVRCVYSDSTAVDGTDYTNVEGAASFVGGAASGTTANCGSLATTSESTYELDETINFTLPTPTSTKGKSYCTLGLLSGLTITNDDSQPTVSISAGAATTEGDAGSSNHTFTATLSNASYQDISVDYITSDGTAIAGTDYTSVSGTVTITAGDTTETFDAPVLGDTLDEANENFSAGISNPTNSTIATASASATIVDDDSPPNLSISDFTVVEGNSGVAKKAFSVSIDTVSGQDITFDYASADGTATVGSDYTALSGSATITAGSTFIELELFYAGDTLYEADETVLMNISNAVNATVTDSQGVGTISNDDTAPTLSIADLTLSEGTGGTVTANVIITQSAASGVATTFDYVSSDGTAEQPGDYTSVSSSGMIGIGLTTTTVDITVQSDALDELDEALTVLISNPSGATISDNSATVTITDDDAEPTLSINDVTQVEGNAGNSNFDFTVSLSAASAKTITVDYATADGTATTADSDYTSTSGTLTFNAGETTKTISVPVIGDTIFEADEGFTVGLSNPASATISDATGDGAITNDEGTPTLSIADVTITEGAGGTATATLTVTMSVISATNVTFDYATADGTAEQPGDYTSTSGSGTINAGSTSATFNITIQSDAVDEVDETLTASIANPSGATIADNSATVTITDDDAAPTLSINDVTQAEGNAGSANFDFTVTLSAASSKTITIDYATANGTATTGDSDYTSTSGTLTFSPGGSLTQTISVPVIGDTVLEADEDFTVGLSNPSNATIADATGDGTITNDEGALNLTVADVTITEGTGGTVNATVTATISGTSASNITFDYATADATAEQPGDYTSASGTGTITAGSTSTTFTVTIQSDALNETDETLTANISNPSGAIITDSSATITITDDDAAPTLSINDVTQNEGNAGNSNFDFTVTLSATSGQAVTVDYATADGTATTANSDYNNTTGTLTFAAGETTKTISVPVVGDTVFEVDENFTVGLSNASNATISDATGGGTITNDEGTPTLNIADLSVTEGTGGTTTATLTITMSATSASNVTFDYATADGSAGQPGDYTSTTGSATITAGSTTTTFAITIQSDALDEIDETLVANISNPSGATISDSSATVTITDDDATPSLAINDVTQVEGNAGNSNFDFTVTLSAASGQAITVDYASADGTATTGNNDYTSTSGTLTFAAGETSKVISVPVLGDTLFEANETFSIGLTNVSNASISDATGDATITNDDGQPTLAIGDATITEGTGGTVTATLTVTLSAASGYATTFDYATANGTAIQPGDYSSASGSGMIGIGLTTTTIDITIQSDALDELNETFTTVISNASNATISDSSATITITDDDAAPTLSINDITQNEGNAGSTNFDFTVTLSAASGQAITVDYATANGTGTTANSDYTNTAGTLTFSPGGALTQTISVPVIGDTVFETDETFTVGLSNPTNSSLTDATGDGVITNDDGTPSLTIADISVTEGNAGTVNAILTVTLSNVSASNVTFDYSTGDVTASQPSDYTSTSGSGTITAGATTTTITVVVQSDILDEDNETFTMGLSNPSGATIADSSATVTITDDDATPTLSINDITQVEGNAGGSNFDFTVTLSAASTKIITVNYATVDSTALAASDYTSTTGTLTFNPGSALTQTISVSVAGDVDFEADEDFNVQLSAASNAGLSDAIGVATITNDDTLPSISIGDITVGEADGNINIPVTLTGTSGSNVTIDYALANVTLAGADYTDITGSGGTLTWAAGATGVQNIALNIVNDTIDEANETLTITLSNPSGATTSNTTATLTVNDDDNQPTLLISNLIVNENIGTAQVLVTLVGSSSSIITADCATSDNTATAGSDYTAVSTTITWAAGETGAKTCDVAINDDTIDEADNNELVDMTLSNASNAIITAANATITIQDNDVDEGIVEFTNATANVDENAGTMVVTIQRSSGTTNTINGTVTYADVEAVEGTDYTVASSPEAFSMAGGVSSTNITITIDDDLLVEGGETFTLTLALDGGSAGVLGATNVLTVTINDDESPGTLSFAKTNIEAWEAMEIACLNIERSGGTNGKFVFDIALSGLSAEAVKDFNANTQTVTMFAGVKRKRICIPLVADTLKEDVETFTATLSNAVVDGVALADVSAFDLSNSIATFKIHEMVSQCGETHCRDTDRCAHLFALKESGEQLICQAPVIAGKFNLNGEVDNVAAKIIVTDKSDINYLRFFSLHTNGDDTSIIINKQNSILHSAIIKGFDGRNPASITSEVYKAEREDLENNMSLINASITTVTSSTMTEPKDLPDFMLEKMIGSPAFVNNLLIYLKDPSVGNQSAFQSDLLDSYNQNISHNGGTP